MATSPLMAQEIILCCLCEERPALLHCNPCKTNLCEDCVGKHTVTSTAYHGIVKYQSRKFHFIFPYCEIHNTEKCVAHCHDCDTPVCMKCLRGPHKGHAVTDLTDDVTTKKHQVEEHTTVLESIISQFELANLDIESQIADLISRCDELQTSVTEQGKECHRVIDDIVKEKKKDIDKMREGAIQDLRKFQNENKTTFLNLKETAQQNKNILQSVNVKEIVQYQFRSYLSMPLHVELHLPNFVIKKTDSYLISTLFGEVTGPKILTKPSKRTYPGLTDGKNFLAETVEIKRFCTKIEKIHRLACLDSGEVWISRENDGIIELFNIRGSPAKAIVSSCSSWKGHPSDISVTPEGELLYTDRKNSYVNVVRNEKSVKLIKVPKDWEPAGVCSTKSGNLLVSLLAMNSEVYKIVRFEDKEIVQEIQKDDYGNPLFKGGSLMLFVTENSNGDICASDCNADTVTVVNKTGRLRYRYKGEQTMEKKFKPSTIVTDAVGNILVEDFGNECIHIIDQDGKFLCSLDYCGRLSIDKLGQLWVGEYDSGAVKVLKYME
ncbi:uncharacterized protein LOC133204606 [Saccostrea echinata]|uniref:uncharacterized protein LOC133204606 n=1 Tax=Saccostrea echinata TaxID=191078 RepID=UPI002A8294B8|nr:uncharacterized protein LOC133204606 [Saccostrea echinata]